MSICVFEWVNTKGNALKASNTQFLWHFSGSVAAKSEKTSIEMLQFCKDDNGYLSRRLWPDLAVVAHCSSFNSNFFFWNKVPQCLREGNRLRIFIQWFGYDDVMAILLLPRRICFYLCSFGWFVGLWLWLHKYYFTDLRENAAYVKRCCVELSQFFPFSTWQFPCTQRKVLAEETDLWKPLRSGFYHVCFKITVVL